MHHRQLDTPRALPLAVAPIATTDRATSHHCEQVPLAVALGGIEDPLDGTVVHADGGGNPVQGVAIAVCSQDGLDHLGGLAGHLRGDQLGGELCGRVVGSGLLGGGRGRGCGPGYGIAVLSRASCRGLSRSRGRAGSRVSGSMCGFVTDRYQGDGRHRNRDVDNEREDRREGWRDPGHG